MARKQSISNKEVINTEGNVKLPGGALPDVEGLGFLDGALNDGAGDDGTQPGVPVQLVAPRDLRIESQKVGFNPDGSQYVTVVVSFETTEQATSHETRVAQG